jgi:hypothetical protein
MLPSNPKTIYSCNEGNYTLWDDAMKAAVGSEEFSSRRLALLCV